MNEADPMKRRQHFSADDFINLDIKEFCVTETKIADDLNHFAR